mgnify:CR=1 FL=1
MSKTGICLKCGSKTDISEKACKCGCKDAVWSKKVKLVDGEIVCECGNRKFRCNGHFDFTDRYVNSLICDCGNAFSVERYRSKEDMYYWDEP